MAFIIFVSSLANVWLEYNQKTGKNQDRVCVCLYVVWVSDSIGVRHCMLTGLRHVFWATFIMLQHLERDLKHCSDLTRCFQSVV